MELWHKGDLNGPGVPDREGRLREYLELLLKVCSRETSADPNHWTPENSLHGHCAVVALLVQEEFGGQFLRASLLEVKGYEQKQMRSHYWNLLPSGAEVDLTAGQFKDKDRELVPAGKTTKRVSHGQEEVLITRESLLAHEPTRKRYILLKQRIYEIEKEKMRQDGTEFESDKQ